MPWPRTLAKRGPNAGCTHATRNADLDERAQVALDAPTMGKFDRRNSQKMKRRKGQAKKKARLKRLRTAAAKPAAATKKSAAKKPAAAKA